MPSKTDPAEHEHRGHYLIKITQVQTSTEHWHHFKMVQYIMEKQMNRKAVEQPEYAIP